MKKTYKISYDSKRAQEILTNNISDNDLKLAKDNTLSVRILNELTCWTYDLSKEGEISFEKKYTPMERFKIIFLLVIDLIIAYTLFSSGFKFEALWLISIPLAFALWEILYNQA